MFKWLFWLGLLAASVIIGFKVIPVYYTNMKIQNVFEGVALGYPDHSEREIMIRVDELFGIQTVDLNSLPPEFLENLVIKKENGKVHISSKYHITLWLLDKPTSVNPDEEYEEKDVKGMDKLRLRARLDFDFAPHAETP